MRLALAEISPEIVYMISQVVKSCFEVLCWKSYDRTFYSSGIAKVFGSPLAKVFLKI